MWWWARTGGYTCPPDRIQGPHPHISSTPAPTIHGATGIGESYLSGVSKEKKAMTTTTNQRTWIGKDIKRREDPALLMGTAIYTNDVNLPGMLHAAVLRSPYPHARIVSIDTSAAKQLPGVYAVLTGRDAAEIIDPLPAFCAEPVVEHAIALEKVRYAGEAVVAVAAESRYIAEDALGLVQISWVALPLEK